MRRTEVASRLDLRWPYLDDAPISRLRRTLGRTVFLASVRRQPLSVTLPDGSRFGAPDGPQRVPNLRVHDPDTFFGRFGRDGALGFGESYLMGAWDCADSDELVDWLARYATFLKATESALWYRLRPLLRRRLPMSEDNSEAGARRNVAAHYDLDPRLFQTFLDPSMTYSSACFEPGDDLAAAQRRKIDQILDLAGVDLGGSVLDIGSGFGALAIRAARERGARVTGLTLSDEQLAYARTRAAEAGVADRVSFLLRDYRAHTGRYDHVVSVEMIEAVGPRHWVDYFQAVDRMLNPGGRFALQAIVFPHRRMLAARHDFSWVDRYIFPGGKLPSRTEIDRILAAHTTLRVVRSRELTDSYAETLRAWRHRFLSAVPAVLDMGFDMTFVRLWTLYLAYFEAGFRSRYCEVWQLAIEQRP
jgi:cyclopropane-fatty-acyl-phospholipid synthase